MPEQALIEKYGIKDRRFHCLDGVQVLPYDRLNDDYCDCDDGSDEPGTSACSGVVTWLSTESSGSGFYCANQGYVGQLIPPSRVNDGICDCCDGQDEWAGAAACPDGCAALAARANERNAERAAVVRQGIAARAVLEAAGAQQRQAQEQEVARLKSLADSAEPGFQQLKQRFERSAAVPRSVICSISRSAPNRLAARIVAACMANSSVEP